MTSRFARLLLLPALSLPLASIATGCVIVGEDTPPRHDPYGDIAFDWSFAGELTCDAASVAELDIVVLQQGVVIDQIFNEPCIGGGLVLSDYFEGLYEVEIDAFARNDALLFSGGFTARVNGGLTTDAGLITLQRFGNPITPPRQDRYGDVGLFWSFAYPGAEPIINCDVAGVREIDLHLTGPAGEQITETFNCREDDGAFFIDLLEGRWTIDIEAFGTFHNADILLFAGAADFTVTADRELDLGDIVLARHEPSFADIRVDWTFNGTSCGLEGIDDVTIAYHRAGLADPEEVLIVACAELSKTVSTFVPGTYTISLSAVGFHTDWFSSAVVDLAPDTMAIVPLQFAPLN